MKIGTRMILVVGVVLLFVLGGAFAFIYDSQQRQAEALYRTQALAIDDCIDMVASTVSKHGGLWAEEKGEHKVNPFLAKVPGLKYEMNNSDGKKFALINGFGFVQEMTGLPTDLSTSELNMRFQFRAPTDKALNPLNNTTPEEQQYLDKMRKENLTEYSTYTKDGNGNLLYVHNRATKTPEKFCVEPCHMDYKLGAIDSMNTVIMPVGKAEAMKQESLKQIVMIFIALLIIVVAVLFLIARYITKPIKELVVAADRISRGETDVSIDIKRNDEIGDLAKAFNRMSASIKILSMNQTDLPKTGS